MIEFLRLHSEGSRRKPSDSGPQSVYQQPSSHSRFRTNFYKYPLNLTNLGFYWNRRMPLLQIKSDNLSFPHSPSPHTWRGVITSEQSCFAKENSPQRSVISWFHNSQLRAKLQSWEVFIPTYHLWCLCTLHPFLPSEVLWPSPPLQPLATSSLGEIHILLCVYGQSGPGAQPKEARAWRRAGTNLTGELIQPSTTSPPLTPSPTQAFSHNPKKEHQCLQPLRTLPRHLVLWAFVAVSLTCPQSLMLS